MLLTVFPIKGGKCKGVYCIIFQLFCMFEKFHKYWGGIEVDRKLEGASFT